MKTNLKPCPFCGGREVVVERLGTPRQSCIVSCQNCGARLESNEQGAGYFWNIRQMAGSKPPANADLVDELQDRLVDEGYAYGKSSSTYKWLEGLISKYRPVPVAPTANDILVGELDELMRWWKEDVLEGLKWEYKDTWAGRMIFSHIQQMIRNRPVPVVKEPSKHYKCPKCHTRFTREYPYKPSDTKEVKEQGEAGLNGAEAVFGFMGWLTSRKEVSGPFSNIHDAGQAAELADEFCKADKLKIENDRWHKILTHPKPTPAPVASGLVEEAFDMLKTLDYLGGLGHERHEQIRSILSRYSKEAK